eukprot:SAG31_NODE_487_length_14980_cov_9.526376_1_plen_64_part_10
MQQLAATAQLAASAQLAAPSTRRGCSVHGAGARGRETYGVLAKPLSSDDTLSGKSSTATIVVTR